MCSIRTRALGIVREILNDLHMVEDDGVLSFLGSALPALLDTCHTRVGPRRRRRRALEQ